MSKLAMRFGRISLGVALLASGLGLAGCAEAEPTLVVVRSVPENDMCETEAGGDKYVAVGSLDPGLGLDAWYYFEVSNNQVAEDGASTNSGTDTSEVVLKKVKVKLSMPQVDGFEPIVYKEQVSSFGLGGGDLLVAPVRIPASYMGQISGAAGGTTPSLLMEVTFEATRTGNKVGKNGGVIEARPFTLPILVSNGISLDCQNTFAETGEELCFAMGNCVADGSAAPQCGHAGNATLTPPCCTGDMGLTTDQCM